MRNTIHKLVGELPGVTVRGADSDATLSGLTADSRAVVAGGAFVAVRGTIVDGHSFIAKAIDGGAKLVVCEDFEELESLVAEHPEVVWAVVPDSARALGLLASAWHGHPSRRLTLVGVTGTNGKTTVATLLYELARIRGHKAGLLSTVENKIGDEIVPATHTTPDPLTLNELLARMAEAGCEFAAMEVSSHAADQQRIAGLDFDGAVFTNLTRDHLDYHGTVANYLRAKQKFFDGLKPEAFALVNADDRNGTIMSQNTRARRATYSIRGEADFRGRVVENRLDGMAIEFSATGEYGNQRGFQEVDMMFAGRFNAANLTAVFGAACLLGWHDDQLLADMSLLRPVAGRFEPIMGRDGIVAIVDYAHTPDALANVLQTINEIRRADQRVITVCGCGGDRDRGKRPIMAAEAAKGSDVVILTSDNPRSEQPEAIIEEMRGGLDSEGMRRTFSITDRREAIRMSAQLANPSDIILIAGKGHETYQIIGKETHHFDDREEARKALGDL